MQSKEAIEQIAYLKELTAKTRLKAVESYPWFILWGIIYIIGYLGSVYLSPGLVLGILCIIGIILSIIFGIRKSKHRKSDNDGNNRLLKQIGIQCLILLLAGSLFFTILIQFKAWSILGAFWPFHIGIIYMVAGVHFGWDMILIGFWMILVSIISVFIPLPYQSIWLAVTAGGGLLFTGILFRYQIKKAGQKIGK